jgi:HEAT repeat protein
MGFKLPIRWILCAALLGAGCDFAGHRGGAPSQIDSLLDARESGKALKLAESLRSQQPADPGIYAAWLRAHLHDPALVEHADTGALLGAEPVAGLASATLIDALRREDAQMRVNAVRLLGRHFGQSAAPHLRFAADDPDAEVRRCAVRQIGLLGDLSSRTVVLLCLKDSSWAVRAEAVAAFAEIAGVGAIPRLALMLDDRDSYVRYQASKTLLDLAKPGSEAAFRALCAPGQRAEARDIGALALAGLGLEEARELLAERVRDGCPDHRVEAARLLAGKWPERAVTAFAGQLPSVTDPALGLVMVRFLEDRGESPAREVAAAYRRRFQEAIAEPSESLGSRDPR